MRGVAGCVGEDAIHGAEAVHYAAPGVVIGVGAEQFGVRLDDEPGVEGDFFFELVLGPAGVAEEDAEFVVLAAGKGEFAFGFFHGLELAGVGFLVPFEGGDDDLVAVDGSAFVDRHVGDVFEGFVDFEFTGGLPEGAVEDEAEGAVLRAMVLEIKDGVVEVRVGHHRMRDEQLSGEISRFGQTLHQ